MQTNTKQEVWKWVVGFDGRYSVSNKGKVCSFIKKPTRPNNPLILAPHPVRVLKPGHHKFGYPRVILTDCRGCRHYELIYHLVLKAFVGPCPEGMEGCHNDGNPKNTNLENLRYDTHSNNIKDSIRQGKSHPPCPKYWQDKIAKLEVKISKMKLTISILKSHR